MNRLDLREAALVGFSMGGGEVARYLGKYVGAREQGGVHRLGAAIPDQGGGQPRRGGRQRLRRTANRLLDSCEDAAVHPSGVVRRLIRYGGAEAMNTALLARAEPSAQVPGHLARRKPTSAASRNPSLFMSLFRSSAKVS